MIFDGRGKMIDGEAIKISHCNSLNRINFNEIYGDNLSFNFWSYKLAKSQFQFFAYVWLHQLAYETKVDMGGKYKCRYIYKRNGKKPYHLTATVFLDKAQFSP